MLIKRGDVGHLEDSSLQAGVGAEGSVVVGGDHFALLKDLVDVGAAVTVVGMRGDVGQCVERVRIDGFVAAFLLTDEPIQALLGAVGEFVPDTQAGIIEVAVLISGREERPHVRERITLGEGTI